MRGLPRPEVTSANGLRVVRSCGLASIFLALVFVLFGFLSRFFLARVQPGVLVCNCLRFASCSVKCACCVLLYYYDSYCVKAVTMQV